MVVVAAGIILWFTCKLQMTDTFVHMIARWSIEFQSDYGFGFKLKKN